MLTMERNPVAASAPLVLEVWVEISEDDEETEDDEIFLLLASEQTSGLTLLLLFWPELVRAVELASGRNEAVLDGRLTTERTKYKTP